MSLNLLSILRGSVVFNLIARSGQLRLLLEQAAALSERASLATGALTDFRIAMSKIKTTFRSFFVAVRKLCEAQSRYYLIHKNAIVQYTEYSPPQNGHIVRGVLLRPKAQSRN